MQPLHSGCPIEQQGTLATLRQLWLRGAPLLVTGTAITALDAVMKP